MKNLLYIFTLFFSFGIYSQGNLQFNKVININGYSSTGLVNNDGIVVNNHQSVTIPEGKVWKITSAVLVKSFATDTGIDGQLTQGSITIGDNAIYSHEIGNWLPYWIGAGTYQLRTYRGSGASSWGARYSISIIEFNIVP